MLFEQLERALRNRVAGDVRFDTGSRATYATDASNYRQVPIGVVAPLSVEDGAAAVAVCREHDVPLLSRGGGTSLGGQCCNTAVVIDWSKYCNAAGPVEDGTVLVEPGIVLDQLNTRTREHGLVFGPRPATHSHCTLGGMLGNNSCGSTAQAYGKTSENVVDLEVVTYDGRRFWTSQPPPELARSLHTLIDRYADEIRRRFPDIPRLVSGYALNELLPENGFNLASALVGSESTLVTILRAEMKLVPEPPGDCLAVIPFANVFDAADAAASVARYRPLALEGIDQNLIDFERRKHLNQTFLDLLPPGGGWLIVKFGAESDEAADARARRMSRELGLQTTVFDDRHKAEEIWKIRESGLGATAWVPMAPDAWPGWEDSAVSPERLGGYLRDLHELQQEHGYEASLYGHFGHGCVHTRIPFDLTTRHGLDNYRSFVEQAADLVVRYGGSLSGEHGDGLARGELWPRMFGPTLMTAFAEFKALFDPRGRMSPDRLVYPDRLDDHLRLGTDYRPPDPPTVFSYPEDEDSFARAALRCVGVGECRRDHGGVMCPSYRVTREERHSTRGRARLLFEMLRGDVVRGGWHSSEVRDALDLCLACKGCRKDCPVDVDMATYKAEFLSHHYRHRVRPLAHYSMGWLPLLARLAGVAPGLVNRLAGSRLVKRLGGITQERPAPPFAPARFSDSYRRRGPRGDGRLGEVVLWPDTFTDNFHPGIGAAAVRVLEQAGFTVRLPKAPVCCGLTWISTGQLHTAKQVIQRTVRVLRDEIRAGLPVVGLEPSCTAVLRSDAAELFPHDEDVARLRAQTVTLVELLERHSVPPPRINRPVLVQPHCHHHAILGTDADARLLRATGADLTMLDAGCCGLAGDFGFTAGHFAVSMACAEYALLPALREAPEEALILADGFSCRTQIEHAGIGRQAIHLAEALDAALGDRLPATYPEQVARRPAAPRIAKVPPLAELRAQALAAGGGVPISEAVTPAPERVAIARPR